MPILKQDIKEKFYLMILNEVSMKDFELWLYADTEIEKTLSSDDYLDLISLGFKKSGAKYELVKLLKKHIDLAEFETYKILKLLKEAQRKTDNLPYILIEFYYLYCDGYHFLRDIGVGFGLLLIVPNIENTAADTWEELTIEQKKNLLDSFSPKLEECIARAINWLEEKKIILTGEQDAGRHYIYEDLRTAVEKKSQVWAKIPSDNSIKINEKTTSKWWRFWERK